MGWFCVLIASSPYIVTRDQQRKADDIGKEKPQPEELKESGGEGVPGEERSAFLATELTLPATVEHQCQSRASEEHER